MNNFRPIGPRDDVSLPDGDQGFIGVEERLAPQQLPPGYVAGARNKRFRNGRAATRDGIGLLPWMKGNGLQPFTNVYGAAVIQDPNSDGALGQGEEWILIAADGGVWKTRPNFVAQSVPLPAGVTLDRTTFRKFLQANAVVLLVRGLGQAPLQCTNLEEGFKPILQQNVFAVTFDHATNRVGLASHNLLAGDPMRFQSGPLVMNQTYYVRDTPTPDAFTVSATPGGAQTTWNTSPTDDAVDPGQVTLLDGAGPIPPAEDGVFFSNRTILINGRDTCVVSDIGDITRYQPVQSEFRINEGDSYTLITVRLFNQDTLVFFKSGNVQKVTGVSGDLTQAAGPLNVTDSYGAVASQAVCSYGTEIYWLTSELRVSSLTLTALNQEQGTNNALSDPLFQTFGRINAAWSDRARIAVYDGFLHVALPLDDATLVSDEEEVASGQVYTTFVPVVLTLVAGQRYRYTQGANGGKLINGTEVLFGPAEFVAQGTAVGLYGLTDAFTGCLDSVRQVLAQGVNTGVAVYDFLNQAWAGTDEAAGVICVVDWLKFTYGGRQRLGFIGADGWLHLYYEGYEDERLQTQAPYVDVVIDDPQHAFLMTGKKIQVNGGTLVTAIEAQDGNAGSTWGVSSASMPTTYDGPQNLWRDSQGHGGFDPTATSPWSAPNTTPVQIGGGVRFISTNGAAPQVKINTVVVPDGAFDDWALLDAHAAQEIGSVPIQDWLRTRAYMPARGRILESKRFLALAAHLATWHPSYTVAVVTPGVQTQETVAEAETRDPLQYLAPFDKPDWDPSNVNDDFNDPRREDYYTVLPATGMFLGANGANVEALQEAVHRVPVQERGVWMQLDISNQTGRLELLTVGTESQDGENLSGVSE